MNGLRWGILIVPVLMIPSAISVVVCIAYAARARTRSSVTLAIGVTGALIVSVATQLFNLFVLPRMFTAKGLPIAANAANWVLSVAALVFGLIFSVSLFLVLRGALSPNPEIEAVGPSADGIAERLRILPPTADSHSAPSRFLPLGFASGLALGIVAVLLLGMGGLIVAKVMMAGPNPESGLIPQVIVSPTSAGARWFSVKPNGAGTLQGWDTGSSGSADANGGTPTKGTILYFDVATVGYADGVLVQHEVPVYLTRATEIVVGDRAYDKRDAASQSEAMFGSDTSQTAGNDVLGSRLLTIDFHRVGSAIVADRISAANTLSVSPLLQ